MKYILFYTESGNTEEVANKLQEQLNDAIVYNILDFDTSILKEEDLLILGSSAYGVEEISEDMDSFIKDLDYKWNGKKVGLFGSYGWGGGIWMDQWVDMMKDLGAIPIADGLRVSADEIDDAPYSEYAIAINNL